MKLLYTSADAVLVGHLQSVLENQGIDAWVKNLNLYGGMGELPPIECWPELWIRNQEDFDLARKIISPFVSPAEKQQSSWRCKCGEELEGQFDICWHCGEPRPA